MIINTGNRTDIPAFYGEWLYRRLEEGRVCVRSPYNHLRVTCYALDPKVVDALLFCTKNPAPMLPHLDRLRAYGQLWFVTVTPYGPDIEPRVPPMDAVVAAVRSLSAALGKHRVVWRYDPVLFHGLYDFAYHCRAFASLAASLEGATTRCVVSFVDLYRKTRRNLPGIQAVQQLERDKLTKEFVKIARAHGMVLQMCAEGKRYEQFGADCSGCMSQKMIEEAIGLPLEIPPGHRPRPACDCLLGNDIGAYQTCLHGCRYCYATADHAAAEKRAQCHNPLSPLLIGDIEEGDEVVAAPMRSYVRRQQDLFSL